MMFSNIFLLHIKVSMGLGNQPLEVNLQCHKYYQETPNCEHFYYRMTCFVSFFLNLQLNWIKVK